MISTFMWMQITTSLLDLAEQMKEFQAQKLRVNTKYKQTSENISYLVQNKSPKW